VGRGTTRLHVRDLDHAWTRCASTERGRRARELATHWRKQTSVAVRKTTPSMRQQGWKAQVSGCRAIHHRRSMAHDAAVGHSVALALSDMRQLNRTLPLSLSFICHLSCRVSSYTQLLYTHIVFLAAAGYPDPPNFGPPPKSRRIL